MIILNQKERERENILLVLPWKNKDTKIEQREKSSFVYTLTPVTSYMFLQYY